MPFDPKYKDINSLLRILLHKHPEKRICRYRKIIAHPFFQYFNFVKFIF